MNIFPAGKFLLQISRDLTVDRTTANRTKVDQTIVDRNDTYFYLFSFLLTIHLKLLIVQVEIKIVNKEAATKLSKKS